jgi:NAD(P)-dependent dehydrogenase (short-subunit alcohol dehydrogenase family)
MDLKGRKVVVVGGSSGIGLATAEMAKHKGAEVIVASRNVAKLDAVAEKLNAVAIPADVTSDASVVDLFRRCGPVDHVAVTAAQLRTGPFKTVSMNDVRATMESKFWGAWRVARSADIRAGKPLVMPETAGSRHIDYRISMYQPMAHVARHKHRVQEQIYHVLKGEGLMEIAGKNHVVRKHDFIFLPLGVEHAISNSGLVDLVFLVITSPVADDEKPV